MAEIVILEDDLVLSGQMKTSLEDIGHTVHVFRSNGPAIYHIDQHTVDLLIADLIIKDSKSDRIFGGISLIAHVRQILKKEFPILAISGTFSTDIKVEAMQTSKTVGATDVLAKPFHPDALEEMVAMHLDIYAGDKAQT